MKIESYIYFWYVHLGNVLIVTLRVFLRLLILNASHFGVDYFYLSNCYFYTIAQGMTKRGLRSTLVAMHPKGDETKPK